MIDETLSVYLLLGPLSMAFQTVAKSQIFWWFWGAPKKNGKKHNVFTKKMKNHKKKWKQPPNLHSGNLLQFAIGHGPVEIVDLPSSKMVVFHRFLYVYHGWYPTFDHLQWVASYGKCPGCPGTKISSIRPWHPKNLPWKLGDTCGITYHIYIYYIYLNYMLYICYLFIYIYYSTYTTSI